MKYILLLALLPYLCFADDQVGSVYCPDGTECEFGKTCCESKNRQTYECCDLAEEDLQSKKLVLAIRPSSAQNISLASTPNNSPYVTCYGTKCSSTFCCHNKYSATCCPNPAYCCPRGARCCTNSYGSTPWCCPRSQRCHSDFGYCRLGAASVKVALVPLLIALAMAVASKYFL